MELVSMHPFCEFMSCYSFSISRIFTVRFRRKRKYLSKLITIKKKNNHSKSYSNRICILLSVFKRIWRRPLSLEERESCLRWITQSQWNRSSNGRRRIRWAPRFLYYKLSFMVEKIIVFLLVCKKVFSAGMPNWSKNAHSQKQGIQYDDSSKSRSRIQISVMLRCFTTLMAVKSTRDWL